MKTLVKIIAALVALIVIAIIAVPMFISAEWVFNTVSSKVKESTGRELSIKGEQSLSVFPSLSLHLEDVHLSNISGSDKPDMASMQSMVVHIPWMTLFSGELAVEKFVINQPVITLEKLKNGQVNWDIAPQGGSTPTEPTQSGGTALPEGFDTRLGEIAINDATFRYIDHQAGSELALDAVTVTMALPSLHQPLSIKGEVTYQAKAFEMATTVTTPAKAMSAEAFDIETKLSSTLFELTYTGNIGAGAKVISGTFALAGDSVKQILAWQKQPLSAKDNAFNAFSISGDMRFADNQLALSQFNASLDALDINGESRITLSQPVDIFADIDLGMLNLNPYLPDPAPGSAPDTAPEASQTDKAQPIVWDTTPLDLSGLKAVNADIKVKSTGLQLREIKLGENAFAVSLKDGLANVTLSKFVAYDGNGTGQVRVNAKGSPIRINTSFTLTDINARDLLTDAAGFDKLMGKGNLNWRLNTNGINQKQLVKRLKGDLGFSFNDGAVKGANIAAMVRSAKNALSGNFAEVNLDENFDQSQQTDFSELSGSFVFERGVGTNTDLHMASPLLRLSGNGTLDLPKTLIDYHLAPKLVTSIQGQGGEESSGFTIPVAIKGPFHDVKIKPDMEAAGKDKLEEKLKDKLGDLFGD